jgi:hypothetical protein
MSRVDSVPVSIKDSDTARRHATSPLTRKTEHSPTSRHHLGHFAKVMLGVFGSPDGAAVGPRASTMWGQSLAMSYVSN